MFARVGGKGYQAYGIDPVQGAIVVVRPDGYVGMISAIDSVRDIDQYFASFMKS